MLTENELNSCLNFLIGSKKVDDFGSTFLKIYLYNTCKKELEGLKKKEIPKHLQEKDFGISYRVQDSPMALSIIISPSFVDKARCSS